MSTFADRVVLFFKELEYIGPLPQGISIMNPFRENPRIIPVISQFYNKFYNDNRSRHLILGINPGRFGAGVTGISFTDTKRLADKCGLSISGLETFETSSVFIYEMIDAFGGAEKFYSEFFITSVSPLGFTAVNGNGKTINYNYYDSKKLMEAVSGFIVESILKQLEFGIIRDICFCLGTGQNYKFILHLNSELKIFGEIVPLEHPRYIMQYKSKQKQFYIDKYIGKFQSI
ncbi:MAG TPA: uracil-DNA glycosylase family protein [Anaerovoracaceae bacterium]|nr:uracil-DNA glycosylase family protein [Anaerovoracaceae bacterium]